MIVPLIYKSLQVFVQMYPVFHVFTIPKVRNVIQCVNHKVTWEQRLVVDRVPMVVHGMMIMDVYLMMVKNVVDWDRINYHVIQLHKIVNLLMDNV